MTTPDTTNAVAQAITTRRGGYWDAVAPFDYQDVAAELANAAVTAHVAELDRLGYDIVKRGSVPSWIQPWGFLKDGGGYIFDGVPTAAGFVCNANLDKNEMRLYRLASHTLKTEDGDE